MPAQDLNGIKNEIHGYSPEIEAEINALMVQSNSESGVLKQLLQAHVDNWSSHFGEALWPQFMNEMGQIQDLANSIHARNGGLLQPYPTLTDPNA